MRAVSAATSPVLFPAAAAADAPQLLPCCYYGASFVATRGRLKAYRQRLHQSLSLGGLHRAAAKIPPSHAAPLQQDGFVLEKDPSHRLALPNRRVKVVLAPAAMAAMLAHMMH